MKKESKTVFITGGTGLIGYELVKDLQAAGFNVCFSSRNDEKIKLIEAQLNTGAGVPFVRGIKVNFLDHPLKTLHAFFKENNIKPNVLINNVRDINYLKVDRNGVTDYNIFLSELELGVIIPYQLSMSLACESVYKLENIINISSIYGVVPPNDSLYVDGYHSSPIQYGVAKAGLIHLTKELAVRLAHINIRVNSISFGGVEGRSDEEFKMRYSRLTPMNRMLSKSEVSGPVKFLISDASSGMTGHNLVYDGGFTIW